MSARKKKKKNRFFAKLFTVLILVLLAGGAVVAWYYYNMIERPNVEVREGDTTFLYIPTGTNFEGVVHILNKDDLLRNERSFRWVAEQKNYPGRVKSGKYLLENGMSNNELVNLLRSGAQVPVHVTFNNIHTLDELAGKIGKQIEPDSAQLQSFFTHDSLIEHYGFNRRTFLAMFIPNTYEMYWNSSAEDFVSRMAEEFKSFWSEKRKEQARSLGLSQTEVAVLASIVQKETNHVDEMPKVAGLYLNRYKKGMKLQADPTVKFAAGDPGLRRIYFKHLEIESPYNTYKYKGLPPGPIAVPERAALKAVLEPAEHNYIYMCAKPDFSGYHNFARTLAQHNRNRNKYVRFLRKEGIH